MRRKCLREFFFHKMQSNTNNKTPSKKTTTKHTTIKTHTTCLLYFTKKNTFVCAGCSFACVPVFCFGLSFFVWVCCSCLWLVVLFGCSVTRNALNMYEGNPLSPLKDKQTQATKHTHQNTKINKTQSYLSVFV